MSNLFTTIIKSLENKINQLEDSVYIPIAFGESVPILIPLKIKLLEIIVNDGTNPSVLYNQTSSTLTITYNTTSANTVINYDAFTKLKYDRILMPVSGVPDEKLEECLDNRAQSSGYFF